METLFIYFIKASGLIGLFYLAYMLLLRKETFFNSNRWFLLLGLFTSVILPLFFITKIIWIEPTTDSFDWSNIPVTTSVSQVAPEINWYFVLGIVYGIGITVLLLKLAFDFYSLSKVLKGKTIQHQADFKLIDLKENIAPFSYFSYIVYNSSLYSETELENILEHEKVHSTQNHTIDVLVSRLFCIVFWFNPLVWLYKKAIAQNLEFIADSEASKNISDKKAYQITLLKITTQENCVVLTNHFYQSLIKKRIVMLNKNQSNKRNSWKYITVFPALVAFVFLFQIEVIAQEKETHKTEIKTIKIDKINSVIDKNTTDEEIKEQCEQMKNLHNIDLTFSNVERNANGEIINIESKYKSDSGSGTYSQSRSPIKPFKFFYDNTTIGYLNLDFSSLSDDENVYINGKKSTQEELDKLDPNKIAGIAVAKISGKKTILVTTKNNSNKNSTDKIIVNATENTVGITTKTKKEENKNSNGNGISFQNLNTKQDFEKPLIIIDGVKQASNFKIEDIPTDQITKIDVLKGIHATGKYGESGKNGVIEITTKENNKTYQFEPSQLKTVQGFKIDQEKKVGGWKVNAIPATQDLRQIIATPDMNIDKAVIIIDGKKTKKSIKDLNMTNIENIQVLKGKTAEEKYGSEGKNGIIEITTKEVTGKNEFQSLQNKTVQGKEIKKENNDWIVGFGTNGQSNSISRIIDNKSINYKKAVIIIDEKLSNYKTLEKLNPNEIESVIQADVKKAPVENRNKAIQLYGKKALNGFIQIKTKTNKNN